MNDNTKRIAQIVLAVILALAALAAVFFKVGTDSQGAVATSMAVQIPEAVITAIRIGIIALLTLGFTWVFNVFGIDLRGQAPVLGLVLATWVTGQLQGLINITPEQWDPFLNTLFYFLTIILAPAGLIYMFKKKDQPSSESYKLI